MIGDRVARIRRKRHLTQEELAARAGVSVETVRKLEQNQRRSTRIRTLHRLAGALDVPTGTLMDGPSPTDPSNPSAGIGDLRRALTPAGAPEVGEMPQLRQLRAAIDEVWQLNGQGHYAYMAKTLPGLIDQARTLVAERPGDMTYRLLAEVYQLSALLLFGVRAEDLACVAVDRLRGAAEDVGDPDSVARAADTRAWLYCRQGRLDDAQQVTTTAADAVEPDRFAAASAADLSPWCGLLQRGVMVAARQDDTALVDDLIGLAGAVARRIGDDRHDQWTVSGPTNVAMHAVRAAVELGEPRRALRLAEEVPPSATLPPAWWARHLLDVAHAQYAVKKDTEAVATLRRIDRLVPGWLPYQGIAREIVVGMRRRGARIRGLRQLAEAMEIDA